MAKYVCKRVAMSAITILIVACLSFLLMMSVPGSPFSAEKALTPQQEETLNAKYGLDKPLLVQMFHYLKNAILYQDLGDSLNMRRNQNVTDIIREAFPFSAQIGLISLGWAVLLGVLLGCLGAYQWGTWVDRLLSVVCTMGISMPGFVVAALLLVLFCTPGGLLHGLGLKSIFHPAMGVRAYIMPCLTLGLYPMCYIARLTRASMLDAIQQDYIKTARAKGLRGSKILFKHALRNAIIPVVTYLGPLTAFTLCGSFVVESAFSIPGLGRYLVQSIQNRDYFVIMGTSLFLGTLMVTMNLVTDIVCMLIDPRITLSKGE